MALVATVTEALSLGDTKVLYYGTLAFDSSYPTGGEAVDLANNERIDVLIAQGNGYTFKLDSANQKLIAYQGDNTNAAAAPGIEVANAANLAAVTGVPFIAIGH